MCVHVGVYVCLCMLIDYWLYYTCLFFNDKYMDQSNIIVFI